LGISDLVQSHGEANFCLMLCAVGGCRFSGISLRAT
jgi:hypothetical protein